MTGDMALPPVKRTVVLVGKVFSLASRFQRMCMQTPSMTALTRSRPRVPKSRLKNMPRAFASSNGQRLPCIHGEKITPLFPAGTCSI